MRHREYKKHPVLPLMVRKMVNLSPHKGDELSIWIYKGGLRMITFDKKVLYCPEIVCETFNGYRTDGSKVLCKYSKNLTHANNFYWAKGGEQVLT